MPARWRNSAPSFIRDVSGVAAIEFGLVGFLILAGVFNAVDLAYYAYQLEEVEDAAQVGVQAAFKLCNAAISPLPAIGNCSGLSATIATAIISTSLGAQVSLASGYPVEGYYCVNTSGALQSVGTSSNEPSNCAAAGESSATPSDYLQIGVTFSYTPLFPGISVMSALGATSIVRTSWIRLG
jgi:Flp pilus assembly protein TadG